MMPRVFSVAEQFDDKLVPLDPEQAQRLRHFDLPPVKYEDLSHYGDGDATVSGFCSRYPLMPHLGGGEVVIDLGIARGTMYGLRLGSGPVDVLHPTGWPPVEPGRSHSNRPPHQ